MMEWGSYLQIKNRQYTPSELSKLAIYVGQLQGQFTRLLSIPCSNHAHPIFEALLGWRAGKGEGDRLV